MTTRRDFLRSAVVWGGLALAGSSKLAASRELTPVAAALRFLAAQQSPDGAWRSERVSAFRGGDALTPVVLWAVSSLPSAHIFTSGLRWLEKLTAEVAGRAEPWLGLTYPLFTASYAAQVFARLGDRPRADVWVDLIEKLRISPALGWPLDDVAVGAWSDASQPPRYVASKPDMLAPNISATTLAALGLVAAGRADRAAPARKFVERCQNFSASPASRFDDGGFFFAINDPIRNKAGVAGADAAGKARLHSYGSATCDGYLALRACGLAPDHPRLQATARWLHEHGDDHGNGRTWNTGRDAARASLVFYHAQARAAVLTELAAREEWARAEGKSLLASLRHRQNSDGSWQGLAPDSGEDEPLLATAFALRAILTLS